MNAT